MTTRALILLLALCSTLPAQAQARKKGVLPKPPTGEPAPWPGDGNGSGSGSGSGAGSTAAPTRRVTHRPLKVVVLAPLTGADAAIGKALVAGVQVVATRINAAGGVRGLPLTIDVKDTGSDTAKAREAALQACDDAQVGAVIGGTTAERARAMRRVLAKAKLPLLAACYLPAPSVGARTAFGLRPSPAQLGQYLARYVRETLKVKRVAVIAERTGAGAALAAAFIAEAKRIKLRIGLEERFVRGGRLPATTLVRRAKERRNKALLLCCGKTEGKYLLKAAASLPFGSPVLTAGELANAAALSKIGAASDGLIAAGTFAPGLGTAQRLEVFPAVGAGRRRRQGGQHEQPRQRARNGSPRARHAGRPLANAAAEPTSPRPAPPATSQAASPALKKRGATPPSRSSSPASKPGNARWKSPSSSNSARAPPTAPCNTPSTRKGVLTNERLAPTSERISSSSLPGEDGQPDRIGDDQQRRQHQDHAEADGPGRGSAPRQRR